MSKLNRSMVAVLGMGLAASLTLSACGSNDTKKEDEKDTKSSSAAAKPSAAAEEEYSASQKRNDDFKNTVSDAELLKGLQEGGYVVFIRHGETEKDYADQAKPTMKEDDCSTQRTLSRKGWDQMTELGAALKKGNIPVGDITSSQYCRAWQSAWLVFGQPPAKEDPALNFAKAEEYTDAQVKKMSDGITPYLVKAPAAGKNNFVIGHDDVFESATALMLGEDKSIYPAPQGVSYVVKPMNGKFKLVAKLNPKDWTALVG